MSWVSLLLAGTAVAVAARWWLRRVDALGRPRPFPTVTVVLLAVLAAAVAVPTYLRHREEDALSRVAGVLVGEHVRVQCQSAGAELVDMGSELGYVRWGPDGLPEHRTLIKRPQCSALRHYLHSDKRHPSEDEVVAVHVLTHESMHMRGLKIEAEAECAAVQHDAETARLLGADGASAVALARRYWLTVYPQMPDDYRSPECTGPPA